MRHLSELDISGDISIWASGESKDSIPLEDCEKIKINTFCIGLNFFRKFKPHARFWMDGRVSQWLDTQDTKDTLLITRPNAFLEPKEKQLPIRYKIDYWYDENVENKKKFWRDGKFTLWELLLMLRHYHPKNNIYLFGVDCWNSKSTRYEKGDVVVKLLDGQRNHMDDIINAFSAQKNDHPEFFEKIFNCNPDSRAKMIQYKDYKELWET